MSTPGKEDKTKPQPSDGESKKGSISKLPDALKNLRTLNLEQRENIFRSRCVVKDKVCDLSSLVVI